MIPRHLFQSKSGHYPWMMLTPIAIAALAVPVAIVAPVRAAMLNTWTFDSDQQQFTFTLPTGTTPTFFLMAQPARIVLTLPNTSLGNVTRSQEYNGDIRSIRLADVEANTRIVLELAPNTRLDPRHAQLTATDLGNGQTQWTLQPLLQDSPGSTIATAPPAVDTLPIAPTPTVSLPPTAPAPGKPETPEAQATTAPVPTVSPSDDAAVPVASDEAAPPESAAEETTATADASADTPETVAPEVDPPEVANAAPSIASSPAPPSLPEVATVVTVGAASALPNAVIARRGVSTSAADLVGSSNAITADVSPDQLPLDPFLASGEPTVSVPDLDDAPIPRSPRVTVPPLSDVPEVATVPTPSAPTEADATAGASLPEAVAIAPPPSPTPSSIPAPPDLPSAASSPSPEAIAVVPPSPAPISSEVMPATGITIPTLPTAPPDWGAIAVAPDNQIPPPNTAPEPPDVPDRITSPTAGTAIAQAPLPDIPSPPPTGTPTPLPSLPPPSLNRLETPLPPTEPVPLTGSPDSSDILPPPPFLEGSDTLPTITGEPSPPPLPNTGVIPFGAPLGPESKSVEDNVQSSAGSNWGQDLPVGTRFALQYARSEPLVLAQQAPVYEVLTVVGDVFHPDTGELILPHGTPILGRFEGFDESGRRFITQLGTANSLNPVLAESDWLLGDRQPQTGNVAIGTAIGAAAVTILSGFSGVGIIGGAALGATIVLAESPQLVSIVPGQTIQMEVVADILPFNSVPLTPQFPNPIAL